jgi:hypothetical protein
MRFKVLLLTIVGCALAVAQVRLSVDRLSEFLRSAAQQKNADKDVAHYLATVKLTERLTDRDIEQLQAEGAVGPRTLSALKALRDESKALPEPKAAAPVAAPVAAPPPDSEEQGKILEQVRDYALNYSRNLPDFICTEQVKRAVAHNAARGDDPDWTDRDTLLIRLSYFEQKEQYKLETVNDRVTDKDYKAVGGAKSFGDFGSLMRGIFDPGTQARFEWDAWATVRGHPAMVFRYSVEQPNSRYELEYEDGRRLVPAYSGRVWLDKRSHNVLRVSVKAEGIPADFPIRSALTALDYDYVELSGNQFLLPMESVVTMSSGGQLSRNTATFHTYHKYSADTTVTFK